MTRAQLITIVRQQGTANGGGPAVAAASEALASFLAAPHALTTRAARGNSTLTPIVRATDSD